MLYEILKTAKLGAGVAPDMFTALRAQASSVSGGEAELSGVPPLTYRSNGLPLISWSIKANTVQSGTPSSQNPVMPQGTGERTGNLLNPAIIENGYNINSNGVIVADNRRIATTQPIDVSSLNEVTVSYTYQGDTINFIYALFNGSTLIQREVSGISGNSIDVSNGNKLYICWYRGSDTITKNDVLNIMLNTGSTALPYEPYGYKISISNNSQNTDVYLGQVQSTRHIKKFVLTGGEAVNYSVIAGNSRFTIDNAFQTADYRIGICSHYKYEFVNANNTVYHTSSNSSATIFIFDNNYTTAADFKTYLQQQYANGTPVTVWYVLATPQTAVVNEPLMKIGDYTDSISDTVSIPTVRGENTLSVGTTVQPSEVYIKYHK